MGWLVSDGHIRIVSENAEEDQAILMTTMCRPMQACT